MKVIRQLADYLSARGLLTFEQHAYLVREGYYPPDPDDGLDLREDDDDDWLNTPAADDEDPYEEHDRAAAQRETRDRRRRSGGHAAKSRPRRATSLTAQLSALSLGWQEPLEGIVQVGRAFAEGWVPWEDAVGAVRSAALESLIDTLAARLDARQPSLAALWDALSLEDYRAPLDSDPRGPTARAYAALLAGADPASLGGHRWLARVPSVRLALDIARAQRRLLVAAGALYHRNPTALAHWLRRDRHDGAYWAFVILHTACRFDRDRPDAPPAPAKSEHAPARPLPDWYAWMRAWGHALQMDPDRVSPFFTLRFAPLLARTYEAEDGGTSAAEVPGFVCPVAWDR